MAAEYTEFSLEDIPPPLFEKMYAARLSSYWFRVEVAIGHAGGRLWLRNRRKAFSDTTIVSYAISRDIQYDRKPEFLSDGTDEVCVFLPDSGSYEGRIGRRHLRFDSRSCLLFRSSTAGSLHMHGPASGLVVRLPYALLRERLRWIEDCCASCDAASERFSYIARTFCSSLLSIDLHDAERPLQATLIDLLTLMLERGAKAYAGDVIPWSFRHLSWSGLQSFLAENFRRQGLSAADAAQALGISERYVYKLMRAHNRTFNSYLLELRLSEARRLIRENPRRVSFGEVAYVCGFKSQSHFSTCYKRTFGLPPRDDA